MQTHSDIFIIGGGINGCAIAADAASRGLSVTLCEKNDLASGTSSASTKLIHGGLRYLELYEFNLVRKALREREILMKRAPYIVTPLEFLLPHEKHLRPAWMIRIGLWIYDHLAKHQGLPNSKIIHLENDIRGSKLSAKIKLGFSYYDCHTDDARLVVLNALSAKDNKARILTHMQVVSAQRENQRWKIEVFNSKTSEISFFYSKCLVNVAGPWVKRTQERIKQSTQFDIELVKGSHIVVPKLYEGDFAYILQNEDKRIIFAIPYHKKFTLIGTTDIFFANDLDHVSISDKEKKYLCNSINHYFKKAISEENIVWSYAGVRCLQKGEASKPSELTRDYRFILDHETACPLLTVIGGKLTTHRVLAEEAIDKLKPYFKTMGPSLTHSQSLPGGHIDDIKKFKNDTKKLYPWIEKDLLDRYIHNYGTRISFILQDTRSMSDLGTHFGHGLYQNEIEYLKNEEWAETVDDILWRRTKLGLFFNETEKQILQNAL